MHFLTTLPVHLSCQHLSCQKPDGALILPIFSKNIFHHMRLRTVHLSCQKFLINTNSNTQGAPLSFAPLSFTRPRSCRYLSLFFVKIFQLIRLRPAPLCFTWDTKKIYKYKRHLEIFYLTTPPTCLK